MKAAQLHTLSYMTTTFCLFHEGNTCSHFSTLKMKPQHDAPLTFPFSDECPPPCLHVQAQVLHHAVDTVVQGKTAGLRLDRLSTHGALVFLLAPLLDAVTAETVSTVQDHCLYQRRGKTTSYCTSGLMVVFVLLLLRSNREQIRNLTSMKSSEQMMHWSSFSRTSVTCVTTSSFWALASS